ncbi:MAG: hypothetical protein H0T52_02725 [Lautropia sp.]|nr:hypothetical protein [Lautropia sp.]
MSDAEKKVFLDAAQAGTAAQRKRVNDDEARGIALLRKEGMTVTEKVDGDAFRKAAVTAQPAHHQQA